MKRRIISLLMAALLLLPISAAVAAGTPVTITSEDVRGSVGDTVTVAINMVVEPPKLGQIMDSIHDHAGDASKPPQLRGQLRRCL